MKNLLILIAILLFSAPVSAVTYKWIDDKGTINFTEDLGNVPHKYRKIVKIVGEEESGPAEVIEDADKVRPKKESVSEPKGTAAQSGGQEKKKTLYDGKEADTWRKEYGIVKADLRAAEEQLLANLKRLQDTSKMSRGEYLSINNTNKALESRILDLREKLDAVRKSATAAGAPADVLE